MTRAHMVGCLLLDTGLRISEALALSMDEVDMENMVLKVRGKGGKHRLVPFSNELRTLLWRYSRAELARGHRRLFATRSDGELTVRIFKRDFKNLGKNLNDPQLAISCGLGQYVKMRSSMKFLVSIYQDEDGAYIAECPSIPGCVSQGQTEAEAESNVADAIRECLAVRAELGMPPTVTTREVEVFV